MSICGVVLMAVLFVSTASTASADAIALSSEKERFEGTWKATEIVWGGERYVGEQIAGNKAVFKGDKVRFTPPPPPGGFVPKKQKRGVGLSGSFSFVLNPSSNPKSIDVIGVDEEKGTKGFGIYRIDREELIICIGADVRPKAFESSEGSSTVLITLKRIEK